MKKRIDLTPSGELVGTVTYTFDDGLAPIVFDITKTSAEVQEWAVYHGLGMARVGDMAAIARKGKDGSVINVTEAMRRDAILAGVNHYESRTVDWDMKAGPRIPAKNAVWLALAEKRGVDYDVIAAEKAAADLAELAAIGE